MKSNKFGILFVCLILLLGTAPLVSAQTATDSDGDGLSDEAEQDTYDTDPTASDTDGDGLSDGKEVNEIGSNPTKADTDGDGITDGTEVERGTDPMKQNDGQQKESDRLIPTFGEFTRGIIIGVLGTAIVGILSTYSFLRIRSASG